MTFNVNPLSKEFSHKDQFSKTLPLRKRSENFGSLNFLEVKDFDDENRVINDHINDDKMEEN